MLACAVLQHPPCNKWLRKWLKTEYNEEYAMVRALLLHRRIFWVFRLMAPDLRMLLACVAVL